MQNNIKKGEYGTFIIQKQMKKALICLILIIVCIIAMNSKYILKIFYKTDYKEYVEKYSEEYQIDPLLVYSIIKAESNFKEEATSYRGAIGLMQLMDKTAREIAENNVMEYETGVTLYNPEKNIKLGIIYLANLQKQYSNISIALAAYNAGIGNVNKWIEEGIIKSDGSDIENIPFKETNTYVRRILKDYKIYKKLYD